MDYALNKGEVISLSVKSRHVVRVNKGGIWLTCGDGCRDHILGHGDSCELGTNGLIVLEALSDSMVSIESGKCTQITFGCGAARLRAV